MDKILWQTLGAFDLTHSSQKCIPSFLLCGKHSTTMHTWIVSRLLFRRRPWRLKIKIRRCLVYFRKSHVCANKLDVQETDLSFTQFYRSWNNFSRCRFTRRRYSRSHSLGPGDWNISFRTEQDWTTQGRAPGNPVAGYQAKPTYIDHIPSNTILSGDGAMLYVFEDDEAVIKMIIKGRSPTMRHVSWTHRVALDWLFDRINLDPKIQIRYVDTKHHSQTYRPKVISHVMSGTSFVQRQPIQLHLLHQEFQLDRLLHNGEEDSRSKRSCCV